MAYLVKQGRLELIFELYPTKNENGIWNDKHDTNRFVYLPPGTIKDLIGKELTENDEPFNLN